jgi:hypothetical protein
MNAISPIEPEPAPAQLTEWRSSIAYISWCDGDSMVSETEAFEAWVRATERKGE